MKIKAARYRGLAQGSSTAHTHKDTDKDMVHKHTEAQGAQRQSAVPSEVRVGRVHCMPAAAQRWDYRSRQTPDSHCTRGAAPSTHLRAACDSAKYRHPTCRERRVRRER